MICTPLRLRITGTRQQAKVLVIDRNRITVSGQLQSGLFDWLENQGCAVSDSVIYPGRKFVRIPARASATNIVSFIRSLNDTCDLSASLTVTDNDYQRQLAAAQLLREVDGIVTAAFETRSQYEKSQFVAVS